MQNMMMYDDSSTSNRYAMLSSPCRWKNLIQYVPLNFLHPLDTIERGVTCKHNFWVNLEAISSKEGVFEGNKVSLFAQMMNQHHNSKDLDLGNPKQIL